MLDALEVGTEEEDVGFVEAIFEVSCCWELSVDGENGRGRMGREGCEGRELLFIDGEEDALLGGEDGLDAEGGRTGSVTVEGRVVGCAVSTESQGPTILPDPKSS